MEWTFYLDVLSMLRLAVTLIVVLLLPGWACITLTGLWKHLAVLQRWCLALGLSIGWYPVLLYGARPITFLHLGYWFQASFLVGCGLLVVYKLRHNWKEQFSFEPLEYVALVGFGITLFTRFWIIRDLPYPASPDSLHHVLITMLTAQSGQLPTSLAPYAPISLDMYHLGLYALAAVVQILAKVPAHAALLWTAQVLNGLCGVGVYFTLDLKVGRWGAVVGVITAGLFSFQPAMLMSWGRFTPVASQSILLIAWMLVWYALEKLRREKSWSWIRVGCMFLAAWLCTAVFEFHFRVAGYFIPLLAITVIWELLLAYRDKALPAVLMGVGGIGLVAVLLAGPVLWNALRAYVDYTNAWYSPGHLQAAEESAAAYYPYTWKWITEAGARTWLLILAVGLGAWGGIRKNAVAVSMLIWVGWLWLMGTAYVLKIPLLQFTNMTAILLMLYLPISLLIGAGVQAVAGCLAEPYRRWVMKGILICCMMGGIVAGRARATEIIPRYHYVTQADVEAMRWINQNIPPGAIFAINALYASPDSYYGTDAGYWIPYFTGRGTTVASMLQVLGPPDYRVRSSKLAALSKQLEADVDVLDDLSRLGVRYVYIGKQGNFSGQGLSSADLVRSAKAEIIYQSEGVTILSIIAPQR